MSDTNPVGTYTALDNTAVDASTYKAQIDANSAAGQRSADNFAAHVSSPPAMTVTLDAGHFMLNGGLVEVAQQTTGTFTAPVGNPRIDRIVVGNATGTLSVITGTPASSPSPPAIPANTSPVAQVLLQTSTSLIGNSMITDERDFTALGTYLTGTNDRANRLINAGMQIDQVKEGASYSMSSGANAYTLDQWPVYYVSAATGVAVQQSSDAPAGFVNSLKVTVGTGAGSVASTDTLQVTQPIEANNVNDLVFGAAGALPVSLSFWVKSSISGTFAATLQNAAGNRTVVNKFSITATNTWQQITIPNIPGDVAGTWASGNAAALNLIITVAAGSSFQTSTLNSWQGAAYTASSTQTSSHLTTSSSTFQLTGAQLNSGVICQPFDKRLFPQELLYCERYYEKSYDAGTAVGAASAAAGAIGTEAAGTSININAQTVPKRVDPSITVYSPNSGTSGKVYDNNGAADLNATGVNPGQKSFTIENSSSTTSGHLYTAHWTANARM
jgi:hypothetical protein